MPLLHIIDVSKDQRTGHITIECCIVDEHDPVNGVGASERWNIEALELATKYRGDSEQWLHHVGREMLRSHRTRHAVHSDILRFKGRKLEINEKGT